YPQSLSSPFVSAQCARSGKVVSVVDTEDQAEDLQREVARARGFRSLLAVPMMRDGAAIGTINVTRVEPGEFDENTIGLMRTFADQAVIAIENTRLFNETNEALAHQTATANILRVISSSIADAKPVFDEILRSVEHLFGADQRVILLAGQ